ncbi:MAG: DUF3291 domain-containing protein [Dehalococcoidia bacterium]
MAANHGWRIAQYNIARLIAPLDDPRIADFVANLERINGLGDRTPGFVWRLVSADGNSTSVRVRNDPLILVNFTIWETIDQLFAFAYHSDHVEFYRRRREWFEHLQYPYLVLWWVPVGHIASVEDAEERLDHLIAHGPTPYAFTFKQRFMPEEAESFAPLLAG